MKKIISLILIISVIISYNYNNMSYAKENKMLIHALSGVVIEADSGRILWERKSKEKRSMASTTKIMTCIIALENGNLNDVVNISKNATKAPPVKMHLKEGETYKLNDLLHALMLQSFNDVAVAIAEHIGGTTENFCNMMTQKAHELGANNTFYKTPNGLDADGHYSTACDLALIADYALKNEKFVEIINTKNYNIQKSDSNSRSVSLINKNSFLNSYSGSNGVKTGFTSKAGYCFVGSAVKNGMHLISVVLASGWPPHRSWKFTDTIKLMDYGFNNFHIKNVLPLNNDYKDISIIKGKKDYISTYIDGGLDLPLCENDNISIEYNVKDKIEAPVNKDQTVGYALLYLNKEIYCKFPIKTHNEVERVDVLYYYKKLILRFFSVNV